MNARTPEQKLSDDLFRSGDSNYMTSLARGLHLIQAFSEDGRREMTMAELTRLCGLPRSVVSRCLYTLQELGFVGRDGHKYHLLPRVLRLGYGYVSSASLPTLAQPILNDLTERTQLASAVVVLDLDDVLYVAKAAAPRRALVSVRVDIGHRRPAYITASGLMLLADLSDSDVDAYFARHSEAEMQLSSSRSIAELRNIIEDGRNHDYVHISLPFAASFSSVAVPVRNVLGKVEAAMVVAIYEPAGDIDSALQEVLPQLTKSANQLSEILVDQAD